MQVEQYKQRVTRKKTSVEAMLKTAVQSQLDGVISGLQQLQSALVDINDIRQRYRLQVISLAECTISKVNLFILYKAT